jgi:hypothetical protein
MRVGRIELLFVARLLFVFVLWLERFVLAARGAAEVVPGWASMLTVPPSAGLLYGAQSNSGGCATRALRALKHARHPLVCDKGQT